MDKIHRSALPADVGELLGGYRNKIINGDFDIWQRATSQTSNGYGSDDRWVNGYSGSTIAHSRQTFTPGQTDVPDNPKYYSSTVVTSVAGAGNYVQKSQRIEGVNTLAGKTATLTFWAKASIAKSIATEFTQQFGTGGTPSSTVDSIGINKVALTTTWQKFSYTIAIPSISGKALGTNGDDSLRLNFWLDAGSSYDSRTSSLGQLSATVDIAHVSLVEGDATDEDDPFSPRHFQQELDLCERYYQKSFRLETAPAQNVGAADGALNIVQTVGASTAQGWTERLHPRMRATPTLTTYNPHAANAHPRNMTIGADATLGGTSAYDDQINFAITTAVGSAAGQNQRIHWTADAELT